MSPELPASGLAGAAARVQVLTQPLGGSPLSQAIQQGNTPAAWNLGRPATPGAWRARAAEVQRAFEGRDWMADIGAAVSAGGPGRQRLDRVAREGGIVVTTGQQPGLFGGPVYTWSKAVSALALADAIQRETGIPAAPLFWAATDDADLLEAQSVWIASDMGARELRGSAAAPPGTPAASTPQGDLRGQLDAVRGASGSAAAGAVLRLLEAAYGDPAATIGAAYLTLLESLLAPLGIAVLDASHVAVRQAGFPLLRTSLERARELEAVLAARSAAIRDAGFEPQVEDVAGLTPVFVYEGGVKRRVQAGEATGVAARADAGSLGANVLLRPLLESAILPTVAYAAGPGELAYFAQVTALAPVLGVRTPMALPRWSATLVEPRMERVLERLGVAREQLADPHAVESALARDAMPAALRDALASMRRGLAAEVDDVETADTTRLLPRGVADGLRQRLARQADRFERRTVAAVKRREADLMTDVARARGFFYPGGKPQERALCLMPTLARHGAGVLDDMLLEARLHAEVLVGTGVAAAPGTGA